MFHRASALLALLLIATAQSACAQEWIITTADLRPQSATIAGIDSTSIQLASGPGGSPATIPLDQFVSATRAASPAVQPSNGFLLLLSDGERLAGRPRALLEDKLAWTNEQLGEVQLPLAQLRGVVAGGADPASITGPLPKQDLVNLRNGDSVSGVFTGSSPTTVTMQADAGTFDVPLAAVSRITFAATGGSAPAPRAPDAASHHFLIGLADGSLVTGTDVSMANDQLSFTFAGDTRHVPLELVQRIEQLDGPVSWLSSRQPTAESTEPFFGPPATPWPARFDSAVDGGPLLAGNQRFERGIGVHARSRLTFAIESGWGAFRTQYAVDRGPQQENRLADMTVRILRDGAVVYERQHVRPGGLSEVVMVPLAGSCQLTLECDYGTDGDVQDRLNWIQPALVRTNPTTQP